MTTEKQGLDDYLIHNGKRAFLDLVSDAMPADGSVSDLYVRFVRTYAGICRQNGTESDEIAREILSKGWRDRIACNTRRQLDEQLAQAWPDLKEAIRRNLLDQLRAETTQYPRPAYGGQHLANNLYVASPGFPVPVKIDALDGDVVYLISPSSPHISTPMLRVLVERTLAPAQPSSGGQGGRPPNPSPADMANAYMAQSVHRADGMLTLRSHRGRVYCYTGAGYEPREDTDIRGDIMAFQRKHPIYNQYAKRNVVEDVFANLWAHDAGGIPSYVQSPCWLGPNGFEPAPGWIRMKNVLVNIENMARVILGETVDEKQIWLPPTPRLFCTTNLPYAFDPQARCPRFEEYLLKVQPDVDIRRQLQMLLGLLLVPDTRYNVFFVLFGPGGCGKSVYVYVLVRVIGETNVCCIPINKLGEKFSTIALTERLANVVSDGDTELKSDGGGMGASEGVLKQVTDGALMHVERKYADPYSAQATARCVFATNSLPSFLDRSTALWDRLRMIPFDVQVRDLPGDNKNLRNELVATELPGIFNFAVHGLAELRRLGRFPDTTVGLAKKEEHRGRCDHEVEFLHEFYTADPAAHPVSSQDLYSKYRGWAQQNGYGALGHGRFEDGVRRAFPGARYDRARGADGKQFRAWYGFRLRGDDEVVPCPR